MNQTAYDANDYAADPPEDTNYSSVGVSGSLADAIGSATATLVNTATLGGYTFRNGQLTAAAAAGNRSITPWLVLGGLALLVIVLAAGGKRGR